MIKSKIEDLNFVPVRSQHFHFEPLFEGHSRVEHDREDVIQIHSQSVLVVDNDLGKLNYAVRGERYRDDVVECFGLGYYQMFDGLFGLELEFPFVGKPMCQN